MDVDVGGGGINEQVESVWSIVSRLMILGDDDEIFCWIGDDEHKQWPSDVIVLNNVKRIGICMNEVVVFNERRRSESFNNRSLESKRETCVIKECGKICCIYDRRIVIGIELWHWR